MREKKISSGQTKSLEGAVHFLAYCEVMLVKWGNGFWRTAQGTIDPRWQWLDYLFAQDQIRAHCPYTAGLVVKGHDQDNVADGRQGG
jgi:hypothetical protein